MANKKNAPFIAAKRVETPEVRAFGKGPDIDLDLLPKGDGVVNVAAKLQATEIANGADADIPIKTGVAKVTQAKIKHVAGTIVNVLGIKGAIAAASPELAAEGTDDNIDVKLTPKGTGVVDTQGGIKNTTEVASGADVDIKLSTGVTKVIQALVKHVAGTIVNRLALGGSIAGVAPALTAEGDDADIDIKITPKGTGGTVFGGMIIHSLVAGIEAGDVQDQAGATLITACINEIAIVGTAGDGVRLPAALGVGAMKITLLNNGANFCKVYPFLGDNLGVGINLPITLDAGETETLASYDDTNWRPLAVSEKSFGTMVDSRNTDVFVVAAQSQPHCYHTNGFTGIDEHGWTFDIGGGGTPVAFTAIADGGGGTSVDVACVGHGLAAGDVISLNNSSPADPNYDKVHVVASINGANEFNVVTPFTATATGTMNQATTITANAGTSGDFHASWHSSGTTVSNNETFDFILSKNADEQAATESRRKFGTGADFGSYGDGGHIEILPGDKISFALTNDDSAGNITLRKLGLVISKL